MPTHPQIFVTLPVKDLQRSVAFFAKLGYAFDPQRTGETAAALIINGSTTVMLMVEDLFKSFSRRPLPDAKKTTGVGIVLAHASREAVDAIVNAAVAAGGRTYDEPTDYGFMYDWGFEDLDGHLWGHAWMDPNAAPGARPGEQA